MLVRLAAAALAAFVLLGAASAQAAFRNPVLPGDYPDPSVVRVGADYYATATSDRWAPAFPVLHSRDLVSWRQVGSVLPEVPAWIRGGRFWAPEITTAHGRLLVLYAALKDEGNFCIAAATALDAAGPWRDRGALLCRHGGAIDPVTVRADDGRHFLVWKERGPNGALWAQEVDLAALEVTGTPVRLIEPEFGWERGVTEGPTLIKRGGWWYLVYSGGNCCRPPCTYVTSVARSRSLLGPYEKRRRPILQGSELLRCPGHGTLVDTPDGRLFFLHHAYAGGDVANRRRQGVLTGAWVDDEGWLAMGDAGVPVAEGIAPLGGVQQPAAAEIRDDFRAPRLGIAWQWVIQRDRPLAWTNRARLHLACGVNALVTRQIATDSFVASVTVQPPKRGQSDGTPALIVRERAGVQRGIEVRDGRVLAVRRKGGDVRLAPSVMVPRRKPVRLFVTVAPGGTVATFVQRGGHLVRVPEGRAARGEGPTRVGLSCRGAGTARFSAFRVTALGDRPLGPPVG